MALLDWMSDVAGPVVRGDGVLLRPPRASDYAAWSALRDGSRDYLQPWEPAWPDDDLSKGAFRRRHLGDRHDPREVALAPVVCNPKTRRTDQKPWAAKVGEQGAEVGHRNPL